MNWTIKELDKATLLDFASRILIEKSNTLTNIYSPLSNKLSSTIRYLTRLEQCRKKPVSIHILLGNVSQVTNFPEGFKWEEIDLDTLNADENAMTNLLDVPKEIEDNELKAHFKHYLEKYPMKDNEEFIRELLEYCKK